MRLRLGLALALLGLLAACGRAKDENAAASNAASNDVIVAPGAEAGVLEPPNAMQPGPAQAPLDRLAGVKVGMTIADLRRAGFAVTKDDGPDPGNNCGYARIASLPDLFFMLDGDTVVRIEVDTPGHPTAGGIEAGMSEVEVLSRLGPAVTIQPHPYTGPKGHYLVVHQAGAPFGLIAETDGKKVLSYRIGRWSYVQWKEGCS
jgi:hypothetical protein